MKDHDDLQKFLNSPRGVSSLQLSLALRTVSTMEDVLDILDAEVGPITDSAKELVLQLLVAIDDFESEVDELRGCVINGCTPPRISDDYL